MQTKNLLIAVLPLLSVKRGRIKSIVTKMLDQEKPSSVSLDLTDVGTCTFEETVMTLIAEALQEFGICNPKPFASPDCKYKGKAVQMFNTVLEQLDARTVRIAFGEQLVSKLDDATNVREAKALLQDSDGDGAVQCIRFRTAQEKKAYLLGVSHADGWLANASLNEFGDAVSKASRLIPVEPL